MCDGNETSFARFPPKIKAARSKQRLFCETSSKNQIARRKTKLFCETSFKNRSCKIQNEAFPRDFLQKSKLQDQKRSFPARLPSKTKVARSKTKLFCETSSKNRSCKIQNAAFLRDFLQKSKLQDPKRSFSARHPSKIEVARSKTKLFRETSFKNRSYKIKNEAFLQDFLQKPKLQDLKRSFSARPPPKIEVARSKTKLFCETSFKNRSYKIKNEAFLRDFLQK